MGNRRALLIVVAVVLAVVAFGGVYVLVSGAEDSAKDDLAQVYVANQAISAGVTLDPSMFTVKKVESRPVDAVTDLSSVTGKVALIPLSQDTALVGSVMGSAAEQSAIGGGGTLSSELEPGQEAVTFSVDQVRGLAGWLQPGDTINLTVLMPPLEGQNEKRVAQILRDLKVIRTTAATELATTTTVASASGQSAPPAAVPPSSGTITVITDAAGAQVIAGASQFEVYLSLNPATTTTAAPTTTTVKAESNKAKN